MDGAAGSWVSGPLHGIARRITAGKNELIEPDKLMKTSNRNGVIVAMVLGLSTISQGCHTHTTHVRYAPVPVSTVKHETVIVQAPAENPAAVARPTSVLAAVSYSPGIAEIVGMVQSGIDESVLVAYVQSSTTRFSPSQAEIDTLRDIGTPEAVIEALLDSAAGVGQGAVAGQSIDQTVPRSIVQAAPSVTAAAPQPVVVQQTVIAPPPVVQAPAVVQYPQFYEGLSPYGSWISVDGYGWCWRPTAAVIDVSWRPYHDRGRWLYSDQGWYWQSDYSWGWAPFHYGRWHLSGRHGWVWMPDTVWGPAWVSWRTSDRYCGWAPLPPEARFDLGVGFSYRGARVGVSFGFGLGDLHYTFVGRDRFCDPTPWRYYRPRHEAHAIYNNTTVINNYVVQSNKTVINRGIGFQEISRVSRSEVRKVSIREMPGQNPGRVKPDRLVKAGSDTVVYRQNVPAMASRGQAGVARQEASKERGAVRSTGNAGGTGSLSRSTVVRKATADSGSGRVVVRSTPTVRSTTTAPVRSSNEVRRSTVSGSTTSPQPVRSAPASSVSSQSRSVQRRSLSATTSTQPSVRSTTSPSLQRRSVPSGPVSPAAAAPSVRSRQSAVPSVSPSPYRQVTRPQATVRSAPTVSSRFEARKTPAPVAPVQRVSPAATRQRTYTPPPASRRVVAPTTVTPRREVVRNTPRPQAAAPAVRSASPASRAMSLPQRSAPTRVSPSQSTPSSRGSSGTVPSRSGGARQQNRGVR
jgi:hypothetical protein